MEYFPLTSPCNFESLPTMNSTPQLHGESMLGITLLSKPLPGYLTFCDRLPEDGAINTDCTSTILVPNHLVQNLAKLFPGAKLVGVPDPRALFIDTLAYLQKSKLIGLTSLLPDNPTISLDARIGENVVIEPGVQIDAGVKIGSGSAVLAGAWLKTGVTVGENTVIGTGGINGYVGHDGKRRCFPHLAGVIIGHDVSVGASCVIVRGILSSTLIGANSIIGNLCNIGHGVETGENVWMSAGTLVGGHTKIGDKATIAIGCTIRDNVSIGANANIGMGSVVTKNVRTGISVFGNPAKSFATIKAGPKR